MVIHAVGGTTPAGGYIGPAILHKKEKGTRGCPSGIVV